MIVDDPGDAGLNFTSEFVESYPAPAHHLPLVPFALVVSGGSFLVGIGGLAIYLGVFLPSNVYGAPPPEEDDPSPDELEPNH